MVRSSGLRRRWRQGGGGGGGPCGLDSVETAELAREVTRMRCLLAALFGHVYWQLQIMRELVSGRASPEVHRSASKCRAILGHASTDSDLTVTYRQPL